MNVRRRYRPSGAGTAHHLVRRGAAPLGILFVLPAVALIVFCGAIPIVNGIRYSLTSWDGVAAPRFVGLANYAKLFRDPTLLSSTRNTLLWVVMVLLFPMLFGARTPNVWGQPWWGLSHFCEQSAYATVVILLLAFASLWLVRGHQWPSGRLASGWITRWPVMMSG